MIELPKILPSWSHPQALNVQSIKLSQKCIAWKFHKYYTMNDHFDWIILHQYRIANKFPCTQFIRVTCMRCRRENLLKSKHGINTDVALGYRNKTITLSIHQCHKSFKRPHQLKCNFYVMQSHFTLISECILNDSIPFKWKPLYCSTNFCPHFGLCNSTLTSIGYAQFIVVHLDAFAIIRCLFDTHLLFTVPKVYLVFHTYN